MKKATLIAGDVVLNLELNDTPLAEQIYQLLPLEGQADHWGEECHFVTAANIKTEAATHAVVNIGDVLFVPEDNAIALGFGPTLWSEDEEIRYKNKVNIWAQCKDDVSQLIFVPNNTPIKIVAA